MKARLISVLLLVAMVMGMIVPSVQVAKAADDPATTGKNAPLDFAASTTQVCPVCGGDAVQWEPLTAITANTALAGGHYYVPEGGISNKAQYNLNSNATRCIHLNGNTLSSTARVFNISNNARLNIFGSGTVESTATTSTGSAMYLSTSRVYLYGGTINAPKATTGNPVRLDGANAKLYIYDGATITSTGRSLQITSSGGVVTMNGGTISGGSSTASGGNIAMVGTSSAAKAVCGFGEGAQITGGQTSFDGQRLSVCVSDFHESVLFAGHTYRVDVIAGKDGGETCVYSQIIDPSEPFYYAMDADNSCDYYRVEVYDESDTRITTGMPTAIGNPIWNQK